MNDSQAERDRQDGHKMVESDTGGKKGQKLARYDLIPPKPLDSLARIYGMGAEKYGDDNWKKGYAWSLNFAAMMRHAWAYWSGEDTDPESGLPHLAHAAWHCMALMHFGNDPDKYGGFDDRPDPDPEPEPEGTFVSGDDFVRRLIEATCAPEPDPVPHVFPLWIIEDYETGPEFHRLVRIDGRDSGRIYPPAIMEDPSLPESGWDGLHEPQVHVWIDVADDQSEDTVRWATFEEARKWWYIHSPVPKSRVFRSKDGYVRVITEDGKSYYRSPVRGDWWKSIMPASTVREKYISLGYAELKDISEQAPILHELKGWLDAKADPEPEPEWPKWYKSAPIAPLPHLIRMDSDNPGDGEYFGFLPYKGRCTFDASPSWWTEARKSGLIPVTPEEAEATLAEWKENAHA